MKKNFSRKGAMEQGANMRFLTPNVIAGLSLFTAILFFATAYMKAQGRAVNVFIGLAFLFLATATFLRGN